MINKEGRPPIVARASRQRDVDPGWYAVSVADDRGRGRGRIRFRNRHRKQGCLLLQECPERLTPPGPRLSRTGGRAIHVIVLSNHIPVFQRAPHNAREWQSPSPAVESNRSGPEVGRRSPDQSAVSVGQAPPYAGLGTTQVLCQTPSRTWSSYSISKRSLCLASSCARALKIRWKLWSSVISASFV